MIKERCTRRVTLGVVKAVNKSLRPPHSNVIEKGEETQSAQSRKSSRGETNR